MGPDKSYKSLENHEEFKQIEFKTGEKVLIE